MKKQISISDHEYEEIEQYLSNNEPDPVLFEEKIRQDPEWPEKVRQVQLTITGIRQAALEEQLRAIRPGNKEASIRHIKRPASRFSWIAVAAALIVIIASLLWAGVFKSRADKLYEAYYQPDTGLLTSMGVAEEYQFDVAMIDYKTGNYKEAIEKWSELLAKHPANDTLNYFIGSSYMAMGQLPEAQSFLAKVISDQQSVFYHDAEWYYGLAQIKEGKLKEAIRHIRASNHDFREELIRKLEK